MTTTPDPQNPKVGDRFTVGPVRRRITAVGETLVLYRQENTGDVDGAERSATFGEVARWVPYVALIDPDRTFYVWSDGLIRSHGRGMAGEIPGGEPVAVRIIGYEVVE